MTRRRNIDEELKISYTKMALNWCVENLGVNRRKRKKLILEINTIEFSLSILFHMLLLFSKSMRKTGEKKRGKIH